MPRSLQDCRSLTDIDREGYRRPLIEGQTNSLYYFFSQTCNGLPDQRSAMKKVAAQNCPVQVVWGKNDEMLLWSPPSRGGKSVTECFSEDVHILNANHFLKEEKLHKVSRLIERFVENN